MDESTRDLLVRGIAAAKANEIDEALFFLNWVLRQDSTIDARIEAWFYLSEIIRDPARQKKYLEEILSADPGEPRARRKLAILEGKLNPADIINPDHFTQPIPEHASTGEAVRFTCPNCGGRMIFSPDGQHLECEFCKTQNQVAGPGNSSPTDDFLVALATARGHSRPVTIHQVTCSGCGVKFSIPPTQLTRTCPYCRTPYALNRAEARDIDEPNGVIPFSISEEDARQTLKDWFTRHKFNPFPHVAQGQGLYLPLWVFNVGGIISWNGYIVKEKITVPISGSKIIWHPNITTLACDHLPESLVPGMWSFDLSAVPDYDARFLADWMAETYSIPPSDASLNAREFVLNLEHDDVRQSISGNVDNLTIDSSHMQVDSYRLILVPVWLTYYERENKSYNLMINGQSGEVFAEKPGFFHSL